MKPKRNSSEAKASAHRRSKGIVKDAPTAALPAVVGRLLRLDQLDVQAIKDRMHAFFTFDELRILRVKEGDFELALIETLTRLHGLKATIDQLHGTFLEVLGSRHALVRAARNMLVELNLREAVEAAFSGELVRAGNGDLPSEAKSAGTVRLPGVLARTLPDEAAIERIVKDLHGTKVRYLRDLTIDGQKFVDRAVVLELANGDFILLLSEEYKTPSSGGVSAQMAKRNNRMFNKAVSEASKVTFVEDHPLGDFGDQQPGEIALGKILLNTRTETSDALAVKASTKRRVMQWTPAYGKAIKEAKATYGEDVDLRTPRNIATFYVKLPYPSAALRNFMTAVHATLPAP